MNATVAKIVDILFQNVEMTDDAQAVRDEVMRNCQDRFDDLHAEGKTDDEAIACVIESLKGMEDVIASYPKKTRETTAADHETGASSAFDEDSEYSSHTFERVARIHYDIREADLTVEPTDGENITVTGEDCPLKAWMEGDCLRVEALSRTQNNGWGRFADLFFRLRGGTVRIGVPRSQQLALALRTVSGDIEVRDVTVGDVEISSTSGDLTLLPNADSRPQRATINTASGDVKAALTAETVKARSMSGDVRMTCDCDRFEASSVSGDVHIDGNCAEATLKSISGDVTLHCLDTAPATVTANSTSGDIRLLLPASVASVHLRASTVAGDVRNGFTDMGPDSQVNATVSTVSGDVVIKRV